MKRRMATLAIVGAMIVAAMAPATVFAATGQSDVYYKHGAGAPEGSDGSYVIEFPTNITFNSQNGAPSQVTHKVPLQKTSETVGLPDNLSVSLTVASENGMKLVDEDNASRKVDYQIKYAVDSSGKVTIGDGITSSDNTIRTDKTGSAPQSPVTADPAVKIATFTGEGTLNGTPTMDFAGAQSMSIPSGTELTDILTYTATQDTPATGI